MKTMEEKIFSLIMDHERMAMSTTPARTSLPGHRAGALRSRRTKSISL